MIDFEEMQEELAGMSGNERRRYDREKRCLGCGHIPQICECTREAKREAIQDYRDWRDRQDLIGSIPDDIHS